MPVTLIDGTEVPESDPRWLAECATRDRHLATMRRLWNTKERGEYLINVAKAEGPAAASRLHLAYQNDYSHRAAALVQIEMELSTREVRA